MLKTARDEVVLPYWRKLIDAVKIWRPSIAMCRCSPVPTASRQRRPPWVKMANVAYRMERQYRQLNRWKSSVKSTARWVTTTPIAAYPEVDWHQFSEEFVTSLGIQWNPYTTQIEPHDYIAELFDCIARFNTILIDFDRDVGLYRAQPLQTEDHRREIGSSTMPHKVNPIDFENSEGNLGGQCGHAAPPANCRFPLAARPDRLHRSA